jgi:hypothetical protein
MNKYTLNDLEIIFNAKGYLPYERFIHYFTLREEYTEKEAKEAYKAFVNFPKQIFGSNWEKSSIDYVMPIAIQIVRDLQKGWSDSSALVNMKSSDKVLRKLIYKKGEDPEIKQVVLNLHDANDIITYAALLKQDIKQIALLRFTAEIQTKNDKKPYLIFEGDFFDTNDSFWGIRSNVYVAEPNNTFRKLLYTKGKGFVRNGELDYDGDLSFNYHAISMNEWVHVGNITTDFVKLTDDGVGS